MDPNKEPQDFFDKPENIQKMLKVFYVICGLLVVADFVVHRHIYHEWEKIPAFYAIYGFVGCVVLVLIAREMRKFLMRGEDYYDE
ncbi:hypothetical protein A3742_06550 [Oleiphilus sp. HI0071]|uniref:hypothetical protein n=1 Tax=unclassified Oleiphilus TaxID=2631174 RepID=UPI0007C25304|nr:MULTISPECIES: hypothetical protein [unclassified Oleiphilus]KZY72975.1 hypothetical protein A3737_09380 [Oleiphilus sp. HI0065]KZY83514.1 hypothetical protein A3742_06550 [Oleiphilus sp. HI0071]KZY97858.1 hypothetical protein A3744_01400 [Oleiphilus sp. HI0073]KZZ41362.1 hypothetical protein A3758_23070 [Oleiphilus sp. HI0118]KZZ48786.1 hypothetical protein A3760_22800 [Oleiphilus sp. HI0122]KZZ73912.1 hypothetical protein A3767_23445 [Oleiphilus sp. HI0133]